MGVLCTWQVKVFAPILTIVWTVVLWRASCNWRDYGVITGKFSWRPFLSLAAIPLFVCGKTGNPCVKGGFSESHDQLFGEIPLL